LLSTSLAVRKKLLGANHPEVAQSLNALANTYNMQGRHAEAEPLYRDALEIHETVHGGRHDDVAKSYMLLAQVCKNMGRYHESEQHYNKALTIYEDLHGRTSMEVSSTLMALGLLHKYQARYTDAVVVYTEALEIAKAVLGAEDYEVSRLLMNLGGVYADMGQYAEAVRYCEQDLAIKQKTLPPDHPRVAKTMGNLASLLIELGDYDEAERLLQQALVIDRKALGTMQMSILENLNSLGHLYELQGKYAAAESLYREALVISEEWVYPDNGFVAEALQSLANIYVFQGRCIDAKDLLKRSVAIFQRVFGGTNYKAGWALRDLSTAYSCQKRYHEAEQTCREALEILERSFGRNHQHVATCLDRLAEILTDQGMFADAQACLTRALEIRRERLGGDHQETAASLKRLAALNRRLGVHDRAEQLLLRSLFTYRAVFGPQHAEVAGCLADLADLHYELGQYVEAESLRYGELAILEAAFGTEHPRVAESIESLARIHASSGEYSESLSHYARFTELRRRFVEYLFSSSSEAQRLRWIEKYPMISNSLLSLAFLRDDERAGRLAAEVVLSGKAVVLDAMMEDKQAAFCSYDETVLKTLDEHSNVCATIANMVFMSEATDPSPETFRDSLVFLHGCADSLEAELSRRCATFKNELAIRRFDVTMLAEALPNGAALWEFLRYQPYDFERVGGEDDKELPDRYLAVVLRPGGNSRLVDLGEASVIDSLVSTSRNMIYDAGPHVFSPMAGQLERRLAEITGRLYERVFAPLRAVSGEIDLVYVSPDGMLNLLPFEILPTPEDTYVIEEYRICYLTCGRDLLRYDSMPSYGAQAVVIADPDFDSAEPQREAMLTEESSTMFASGLDQTILPLMRGGGGCLSTGFTPLRYGRQEALLVTEALRDIGGLNDARLLLRSAVGVGCRVQCESAAALRFGARRCQSLHERNR
jgi:tetratricopeptide (TPR) repeat protein